MASIIIFTVLAGFYFFYHTSEKASPPRSLAIEKWIYKNKSAGNAIGAGIQVAAFILSVMAWGLGSGTLFYFIILMTVSSLVIILSPAKIMDYKAVFSIAVLSLICEVII